MNEWPAEIQRPPAVDELPYDDGEPMESEWHRKQMVLLVTTLESHFADRDDVYVAGNMGLFYSVLQKRGTKHRAPDVFVVLDTDRRERKAWVIWEEDGQSPDVVIEILSTSTAAVDRGEKKRIYSRVLRIPEYFLYDPETQLIEGFGLAVRGGGYEPMRAPGPGPIRSERLGLVLSTWQGTYAGLASTWVRWYTPDGALLPTGEEQAAAAMEQLRAAEQRARQQEQARIALEEQVATLLARLR